MEWEQAVLKLSRSLAGVALRSLNNRGIVDRQEPWVTALQQDMGFVQPVPAQSERRIEAGKPAPDGTGQSDTGEKAPAEKAATSKKITARKTTAKKATTRKPAAKKKATTAKKTAARKTVAKKKATRKKTAGQKTG